MVLGEFLKEIKKTPSSVKFAEMANILVIHCQVSDESKLSEFNFSLKAAVPFYETIWVVLYHMSVFPGYCYQSICMIDY